MNKTPKTDRPAHDASTEILANLLIDLDAYSAALIERSSTHEAYSNICHRVDTLAERLGTTFGEVLADKRRIEDELEAIKR